MLLSLPTEIVLHILQLCLEGGSSLTSLCLVNSQLLQLTQTLLHGDLRFQFGLQLALFANNGPTTMAVPTQTMTVRLAGGTKDPDLFDNIEGVFKRCLRAAPTDGLSVNTPQALPLDELSLRLNTHTFDPQPFLIHRALTSVNPRRFSWTGPDPDHHFSNAIVPLAAYHLLRAIDQWSRLRELILSSISFKYFDDPEQASPLQELLPDLQLISFQQCIFLAPRHVVAILSTQPGVVKLRLIDAYRESIWGRRIRRSDVENAIKRTEENEVRQLIERIHNVVSCEKRTERIVGGDRVEDDVVFLY